MAISIRLPKELERRLDNLAKETHRSKSYYVREALARTLDDIEDYYVALYRLENPSGKLWTHDEVVKSLGLDKKKKPRK